MTPSRPAEQTVYVQSIDMWVVIEPVLGDPHAYRISRIVPGQAPEGGLVTPSVPRPADTVIPDLVALEEIMASYNLVRADKPRRALRHVWRWLKWTNIDRWSKRVTSTTVMHTLDDPLQRDAKVHQTGQRFRLFLYIAMALIALSFIVSLLLYLFS